MTVSLVRESRSGVMMGCSRPLRARDRWIFEAGTRVWRALLANVQNGERIGFADLASLLMFLKEQTGGNARPDPDLLSTAP